MLQGSKSLTNKGKLIQSLSDYSAQHPEVDMSFVPKTFSMSSADSVVALRELVSAECTVVDRIECNIY